MSEWNRPVIVFYRERIEKPENRAFAVVKALRLAFTEEENKLKGKIVEFFPLMGDIDNIFSGEGLQDKYVLCWFDDSEKDFDKSWRRLNGVTFSSEPIVSRDKQGKSSFNAEFQADKAKLRTNSAEPKQEYSLQ